jgi:hypothetical protein
LPNIVLHPNVVDKFPWAKFPNIDARNPNDRDKNIRLQISGGFIIGNLRKNLRTPIFQSWAHLVGVLPPVPNVAFLKERGVSPTLTTLLDAHACFRGVSRPHGSELDGGSVYTYLIKVGITLRFDDTPPVSMPAIQRLEADLGLAVYVKADEGLQSNGESVWGTALRIELIETSPEGTGLPVDHESRYDERLW